MKKLLLVLFTFLLSVAAYGFGNGSTDVAQPVIVTNCNGSTPQYFGTPSQPVTMTKMCGGITTLTGEVTAGPGTGSVAATVSNAAVIAKVLTGFVSGAGTVSATDTILQAIQKVAGNVGLYLPLTGGTLTGELIINEVANSTLRLKGTSQDSIFVSEKGLSDRLYLQNNGATMMIWDGSAGTVQLASAPLFGGNQDFRTNAAISAGTQAPDASAQLQADSTSKGFAPPRMTTAQKLAISSPLEGLIVYDTTLHKACVFNGTTWETITSI